MSAKGTLYTFGRYTLRPATEDDLDLARKWTEADEAHHGVIAPGFWIEQDAGVDSYVLSDDEGPLFFFRMQRTVRLFIQFAPGQPERTRKGLEEGLGWLSNALLFVGVSEILFDSASILLRRFVTGKLGFRPQRDTLSRAVVRPLIRRPIPDLPPDVLAEIECGLTAAVTVNQEP